MKRNRPPSRRQKQSWTGRFTVEFSGLERPRQWIFGLAVVVGVVLITMLIAYLAFG